MQWQRFLGFPDDVHLSGEAEDLIRRFAVVSLLIGLTTECYWQTYNIR